MRKTIWIPTLQGILVTALFLATEVILQKLGAFNGPIRRYAVDILLRFLFGLIALFLIQRCYRKDRSEYKLGEYFTNEIPRTIWFYLIPFIAYLLVQFSFILFANKTNTVVAGMFALDCLQQFGQDISSTLWQVGSCFIWGSFIAAIFMISRNIALLMILHAVWDIVIRIPNTFFGLPEECLGLTVLDVGGYAVSYTAMLAVAFFIAINYDNYVLKG